MATFDRRIDKDDQYVYRARVRRKGYASQVATLRKLSDAKKWASVTASAMLEGRHFKTSEAKSHTLAELIDRYILPGMVSLSSPQEPSGCLIMRG